MASFDCFDSIIIILSSHFDTALPHMQFGNFHLSGSPNSYVPLKNLRRMFTHSIYHVKIAVSTTTTTTTTTTSVIVIKITGLIRTNLGINIILFQSPTCMLWMGSAACSGAKNTSLLTYILLMYCFLFVSFLSLLGKCSKTPVTEIFR